MLLHPKEVTLKRRGKKKADGIAYLNCLYTNATSLVNTCDDFISLINTSKFPHILMVTETWFNQKSIKSIPNYTLFNKDREQIIGGGVAIYIRNDLSAVEVGEDGLATAVGEQVWCNVITNSDSLLINWLYLSTAVLQL